MSINSPNIAMLRALSNALEAENVKAVALGQNHRGEDGVDDVYQNAAMLAHLALACRKAADDLDDQDAALVASVTL